MALTKATYGMISADTSSIDLNIDGNTLYVDSSANRVGIGTNSPDAPLRIDHESNSVAFKVTGGGSGYNLAEFVRDVGATATIAINASGADPQMYFTSTGNVFSIGVNSNSFEIADSQHLGTNTRLSIDYQGNVGIGTTSPANKLHVDHGNLALGFDSGILSSANLTDYTVGRGSGITMKNADVYTAGVYGIRQAGGWDGALVFYTHTNASNNTFGTTFTEKMRIGQDGKVGIGTASPDNALHVQTAALSSRGASNGNTLLTLEHSTDTGIQFFGATQTQLRFGDAADTAAGAIIYTHSDNILRFAAASAHRFLIGSSEKARIDSSGNLLVGKTSSGSNTVGFETSNYGQTIATTSGASALMLNRKTSDGDIAVFRKDGTTVGSIGTNSGLFIGSTYGTDSGLRFASSIIAPSTTTGANRDAAIDLGYSSSRFKDLYLSNSTIVNSRTIYGSGGFWDNATNGNNTGVKTGGNHIFLTDGNGAVANGLRDIGISSRRVKDIHLAGSVYADLIRHKEDTDTYIQWPGNNQLAFNTGASERMRIDASGKVRIGATFGLNHLLNIQTASTSGLAQIEFRNTQAGTQIGMAANTNALSFFTGDAERIRIDNKGSVGVGVTPNTGWNSNATGGRVPIQVGFGSISGRLNDLHTEFTNNAYASGAGNDPQWAGITRWAKSQIEHDSGGQIIFKTSPVVSEAAHNSNPNITWTEQVVITNNGSVGIGPVAPQTKLHVESSDGSGIRVSRTSATAYMQLFPAYSNVPTIMGLGAGGLHLGYNSATAGIRIATNNNVGIGTSSPSTKLTVKNDSASTSFGANNIITIQNANTTDNSRMGLAFTGNTGIGSGLALVEAQSYDQSHGKTSLNFSVYSGSWHNDMMVLKEGNVGIGEDSPSAAISIGTANTYVQEWEYAKGFKRNDTGASGANGNYNESTYINVQSYRGTCVDYFESGHYFNNGAAYYFRHSRIYVIMEGSTLRVADVVLVRSTGNRTDAIVNAPSIAVSASTQFTITSTVLSGFTHYVSVDVTGAGFKSIGSIG